MNKTIFCQPAPLAKAFQAQIISSFGQQVLELILKERMENHQKILKNLATKKKTPKFDTPHE